MNNVKSAVLKLRALNNKTRNRIIEFIKANQGCTVTNVWVSLRLEQSIASQHLAILRKQGFVETERRGKFIQYRTIEEEFKRVEDLMDQLAGKGREIKKGIDVRRKTVA